MTLPKDVLVVEDDELSRFVIAEMCRELGFQCLTASGGQQAIDVVTENASTIGVVLMDIHMPAVSGLTVTKAIRDHPSDPPKNLPVVAITADIQ
ncbi:response regulator [uncultured Roseovarius sp.]|uniref:response regulator n=1 Tax=uncultured Roseovarius sp. TaxID=293344 RepID=UPI0026105FDF|nr:response regulator [uncultured Roseovarius sp.]